MKETQAELPKIVSSAEWQAARDKLLAKEEELTRVRAAVAAERRRLPMVRVDKSYSFDGRLRRGRAGHQRVHHGAAAHDRKMMVTLFAYTYAIGERSSRAPSAAAARTSPPG